MFFNVTDDMRSFIEKTQYQSIQALSITPKEIESKIYNEIVEFYELEVNSETQDIDFSIELDNKLKSFYQIIKKDSDFYHIVPEYHYETTFEYFKYMSFGGVTKYDNPAFISRFSNLIPLCHDVFTGGDKQLRKNIIVTSLPFLDLNGICVKYDQRTDLVYLNSGLLSILPSIYQFLLPFFNSTLFGDRYKGKRLSAIIDIILKANLFENSYEEILQNDEVSMPHANESWFRDSHLTDITQGNILNNGKEDANNSIFKRHPNEIPFSTMMGHFYACRGAYVFLLGHEFSHAYNEHSHIKAMDEINLRPENFHQILDDEIKHALEQFSGLSPNNRNYCVNQPIEEEADAHALLCVSKYCLDNELDEQRVQCVFTGVAAAFVVMEIKNHISLIQSLGIQGTKEYVSIPAIVRNMLFSGEHPSPITRLSLALNHEQHKHSELEKYLKSLDIDATTIFSSLLSSMFDTNPIKLEKDLQSSKMFNYDLTSIFNEQFSVGAADVSNAHFAGIKEKFQKKKKSNVIQLFS